MTEHMTRPKFNERSLGWCLLLPLCVRVRVRPTGYKTDYLLCVTLPLKEKTNNRKCAQMLKHTATLTAMWNDIQSLQVQMQLDIHETVLDLPELHLKDIMVFPYFSIYTNKKIYLCLRLNRQQLSFKLVSVGRLGRNPDSLMDGD